MYIVSIRHFLTLLFDYVRAAEALRLLRHRRTRAVRHVAAAGRGVGVAHALEVALAEHKARELEKQLRELFVYSGQGDVYKSMMRARQKERQRRLQAARRQAEQKKFILDMFLIGSVVVVGILFLGFIVKIAIGL